MAGTKGSHMALLKLFSDICKSMKGNSKEPDRMNRIGEPENTHGIPGPDDSPRDMKG